MTLVGRILEARVQPEITRLKKLYDEECPNIRARQLQSFSSVWDDVRQNVPYYRDRVAAGELPSEIGCWEGFLQLPIQTRDMVRAHMPELIDTRRPPDRWSSTGGSTGEPLRFPVWRSQVAFTEPVHWLGRAEYGVRRSDRLFMLWGHHLQTGWRHVMHNARRSLKDGLLGYVRFSAYDLSPDRLRRAADLMLRARPRYIIAYSNALSAFARANEDRSAELSALRLKVAIGAAERFLSPQDRQLISSVLGCPVGMEYGSRETIIIAHTLPSADYRTYWHIYLVEPHELRDGKARLLVTALYPRSLPLIRYDMGDVAEGVQLDHGAVVGFRRLVGRANDYVELWDGTVIHPLTFVQHLRTVAGVLAFQIRCRAKRDIVIDLMCREDLGPETQALVRKRVGLVHPAIGKVDVRCVRQLTQTPAGKLKWVIEE